MGWPARRSRRRSTPRSAGHGRIVSKPRIAAESGGTAKIITGDALPILTSIALSGVNAVQQQVQYVNVGVTLQIAPRVTNDGFVTSHVFCRGLQRHRLLQGYPTISQREASTSATVKDGEAFIIGGLTQDSHLRSYQKVPLAGDVPVLGQLFRVENSSRAQDRALHRGHPAHRARQRPRRRRGAGAKAAVPLTRLELAEMSRGVGEP